MPDTFGALEVPVPVPTNPRTEAVGDPLLDLVASFAKAVLNADVGAAWAEVYPLRNKPGAVSLPVMHTATFDPNEGAFTTEHTPCLYVFRSEDPAPQRIRTTQDWEVVRSPISLLLVPPPPTQDKQKLRTNMRNAVDKSIRGAVRAGKHPAWVVDGDTLYGADVYGSAFLRQAQLQSWQFSVGGFKRVPIIVEDEDGNRKPEYFGLLGTVLVDELLVRGTDLYVPLADVRGTVSVGGDELAKNALPVAPYQFLTTIQTCTPSAGTVAGGTVVTISGHQLFVDDKGEGLTVATSDGVPLDDVVLVDESRLTAVMPPHAPGLVGLVVTLPSGATAELPAAFTYA